ncbi:ABC transporter permease [Brevibacillus daliensis]|uniref:ABC transporter permease n=1 Tax=Brevibacillus daliensis TaxID=2892995 RepID=UPI001E565C21|nr:ABC transporter permease [Brevibacillus daliensis]
MYDLVYNESLKLIKRKRFYVVLLILIVLIPLFTYAQFRSAEVARSQIGTDDWRTMLQQKIVDTQNRLASSRIPPEWRDYLETQLSLQQYYLDHNIDPSSPGAVTFARGFMDQAISLFLPMMIVILAVDLVSSEFSEGTIKLLLTRPVKRWKILTSKFITLFLFTSLTIVVSLLFSYVISGIVFGYSGWTMPVLTGFTFSADTLDTSSVFVLEQWKYILMQYGLGWFVCMVIGAISMMISVLVRSTAAGMGIMMAALVSGVILTQMAANWEQAKYLFNVNLQLTSYLAGTLPPIKGMSLPFSLSVLSIWGIISMIVAYVVFIRQDVR